MAARLFLLLALFCANVFATSLVSLSVAEKEGGVELVFTFDSPFEGQLEQNATVLNVHGALLDTKREITLANNMIGRIVIDRSEPEGFFVLFESNATLTLRASKLSDGYKLQLFAVAAKSQPQESAQAAQLPMIGKDTPDLGWRYVVVILFLSVLAFGLFVLKRRLVRGGAGSVFTLPKKSNDGIVILRQNHIDPKNKLVLIEFEGVRYLILVGNTNVVVDKFYTAQAQGESEPFGVVMRENERRLAEFLQSSDPSLDGYRLKAEETL